jgi:hypothetical protein
MRVKIFQTTGFDGITKVEEEINSWLSADAGRTVRHTDSALCQVARNPTGERYQCLVVTVWYE